MKIHEIVSNGERFVFHVIKNTATPCPHCGVPACGKEDIIWYILENKRIAMIFDGGYFDLALEECLAQHRATINYDDFPDFIKDWNECKGWESYWDYDGYSLPIDDFLKTIELLKSCEIGKWITMNEIKTMQELSTEAKKQKATLRITRG